ncbi:sigma 54-interacting transcriptional regulator [Sporomusa malonica]|uniref:PAS domain S-box-containing protein n=1 Tax=Sporomusa malonica TaxID=112901 RepID=A0A1W1Y9Y5_9FIRM|nr:sigma 54-interacting transcriptional regulator [Sporomusa malonica]SMC32953.1 PAS domain S-box-containing protein [Sporomusa malonica]
MSQITFVSPYRDLSLLAQSVADEMGINIEVFEGIMGENGWAGWKGDSSQAKSKLGASLGDVLVSRGGTAFHLARNLNLPVVTVNTGPFDIIECCKQAKQFSLNIVITTFSPLVGLGLIEEILGVTITEIVITSLPELEMQIAKLAEEGNYCVVGGGASIPYAKKYGVPSVFLHTSRDTIREALLRAEELAKLHYEEKRRTSRLKAIVDCAYEGIIAVDENGKIDLFNHAAEKILGIKVEEVIGRKVVEVIPNTCMHEVLSDGQLHINEFQDVGDVRIVTNRVPINDGQRIVGAVATFQEASRIVQIEHQMRKAITEQKFRAKLTFANILGQSPIIKQKKDLARKFAASDLTIFINGPSGTGKELFAQGIHHASQRASGPFVAVNCGALPQSLLESELFGYAEGAFTGAKRKGKAGLFEMAHGGTIFLDEIDAMPIDMQGRLLRVLQEREVLRIGAEGIIPVDIRVVAASNKTPQKLLETGLIREDLFYRLNVLYLEIPPLNMRKEDIPLLCREFLLADKRELAAPLIADMMPYLMKYSWPGNVRELLNFTQRLSFFLDDCKAGDSGVDLLKIIAPDLIQDRNKTATDSSLRAQIAAQEEVMISRVLEKSTTIAEAAAQLGIPKTTLWRKIQKLKER